MTYKYYTCCIDSTASLINNMTETAKQITPKTFFKHISLKEVNDMFDYDTGPLNSIKKDRYVTYYKSKYGGQTCYYLTHSAIEYIFLNN